MIVRNLQDLARVVRRTRRAVGATQDQLALTAGTNRRVVIELEKGKETMQIGKVFQILRTLGLRVVLEPPPGVQVVPTASKEPHD